MSSFKKNYIGIIANSTSLNNRVELVNLLGNPQKGIFAPLEFSYKNLRGGIVPLDIQPQEVLSLNGARKGRQYLVEAVDFLINQGAKVICLAASTKRLAGKSGEFLKKRYPDIIFTIGDNATSISFKILIDQLINYSNFNKESDTVFVLGGGFLGKQAVEFLLKNNCQNIIVLSEHKQDFPASVKVIKQLDKLDSKVELFIACTHKYNLPISSLNFLKSDSVIVDIAVPAAISQDLFNSLPLTIRRFNAGDFFLKDVYYNFPSEILSIPVKQIWYGCFTEAIILSMIIYDSILIKAYDFFDINQRNEVLLYQYLKKEGISVPLINFYQMNSYALINL